MRGIYTYTPETNCVSRAHNVAAILQSQFRAHVMLFPMLSVCTFTLVLSEVCVQWPIWLFCVVPWFRASPLLGICGWGNWGKVSCAVASRWDDVTREFGAIQYLCGKMIQYAVWCGSSCIWCHGLRLSGAHWYPSHTFYTFLQSTNTNHDTPHDLYVAQEVAHITTDITFVFTFHNLLNLLLYHISVPWSATCSFFIITDYDIRFIVKDGSVGFHLIIPYIHDLFYWFWYMLIQTTALCLILPLFRPIRWSAVEQTFYHVLFFCKHWAYWHNAVSCLLKWLTQLAFAICFCLQYFCCLVFGCYYCTLSFCFQVSPLQPQERVFLTDKLSNILVTHYFAFTFFP